MGFWLKSILSAGDKQKKMNGVLLHFRIILFYFVPFPTILSKWHCLCVRLPYAKSSVLGAKAASCPFLWITWSDRPHTRQFFINFKYPRKM